MIGPHHTYTATTALVATRPKVTTDLVNYAYPIALKTGTEELQAHNKKAPKGYKLNPKRLHADLTYAIRNQVSYDVKIYSDSEYQHWIDTLPSSKRKASQELSPHRSTHPRTNNSEPDSPTSPPYSPAFASASAAYQDSDTDSDLFAPHSDSDDDELDLNTKYKPNPETEKENTGKNEF
jgi:hypothetical protein